MSAVIIGIDPGKTGAVAILQEDRCTVCDLPVAGSRIDAYELQNIVAVATWFPNIYLERAQSMPKQGLSSTFAYGVTYGQILATLQINKCKIHEVAPGKWKRAMGLTARKADARELAIHLFPQLRDRLKLKKHHHRAEALLIAEYGRRLEGRG